MPAQGDLKLSLRQIQAELKLEEDMACADVATIKDLGGNKYGEMRTFTGSPIDWLVKSWLGESHASRGEGTHWCALATGNPAMGFTNIHLTAWCDASIEVPHLGETRRIVCAPHSPGREG